MPFKTTLTTGPLYISWNYTYACNFNCTHCYSRAPSYPPELTTAEYERVVEQIIEARVFKVGLGGGEPLMRRDSVRILARMGAAGIDTNVTTNGWFVDNRTATRLAAAYLGTLYVSLDSPDEAEHDAFRNKPGSYQRVLKALEAAVGAGLNVRLSTVVTAANVSKLGRIVRLAEAIRVKGIEFKRFRPSGNGVQTRDRYQLREDQEVRLRQSIAAFKANSPLDIALIYGAEPDGRGDSGCPCGTKSICIRPNGDVSPCAYGETVIGNLINRRLPDLWRNSSELKIMREGGGCMALTVNPLPSNPYLHAGPTPLPVIEGAR